MDPLFDTLVLVRWAHFGAMVMLLGGALFWAYAPAEPDTAMSATWRLGLRATRIAALVALATGIGWLAATVLNMAGLDGFADLDTLHAFFFETTFGPIEIVRMALLVVVAVLPFAPMPDRLRLALVAIASALLLVSQAWLGHAAAGGDTGRGAVMIVAYAAHVLAGAAWLGGLPLLLARIAELRRLGAPPGSLLRLLSRFSLMASLAVGVIVASGVANAAFRVNGRFDALLSTPYGDVLIAKVALVGLMLGFAAYNRLVAMPRLQSPDRCGPPVIARAAASVGCEMLLGAMVLLAAAILGITPPPVG